MLLRRSASPPFSRACVRFCCSWPSPTKICCSAPRPPYCRLELLLPRLHPRAVMLLGDFHRTVAKQDGDLINRDAAQEQLDGKRVAEPMRMAVLHVSQDEQLPKRSLPIGYHRFRQPVAGPEEIRSAP